MKKCFALIALLGIVDATVPAMANTGSCVVTECKRDRNNNLVIPGVGCYTCGTDGLGNLFCDTGDVVAVFGSAEIRGRTGGIYNNKMYVCNRAGWVGDSRWDVSDIPICTQNEYTILKNDSNAEQFVLNPDTRGPINNNKKSQVIEGNRVCIGYICKSGYTERNGRCVSNDVVGAAQACESTGGTWNGNSCSCASSKHLKLESDRCVCTSGDYVFNASTKRCDLTQEAKNKDKKSACESTGGTWNGGACTCDKNKGITLSGGRCVCLDGYTWATDKKSCRITDDEQYKRDCEKAGGYYNPNNSTNPCECKTLGHVFYGGRCQDDPKKAECDKIADAEWESGECVCNDKTKIVKGGKCIENPDVTACNNIPGAAWNGKECRCKDANKELKDNACVETEEYKQRTQEQKTSALTAEITAAHTKFSDLTGDLKDKKWRNADGKFNTARLASDGVAGVVLGTTAGLVTAHVVKKGQVKNGYEDIKCSIGGQEVSDWGDELTVGVR